MLAGGGKAAAGGERGEEKEARPYFRRNIRLYLAPKEHDPGAKRGELGRKIAFTRKGGLFTVAYLRSQILAYDRAQDSKSIP